MSNYIGHAVVIAKFILAHRGRQEKAKEGVDMSVTKAQEGKTKDQVKLKRTSGFFENRFFFPNALPSETYAVNFSFL